jgi:hypothetical protein
MTTRGDGIAVEQLLDVPAALAVRALGNVEVGVELALALAVPGRAQQLAIEVDDVGRSFSTSRK